MDLVQDLLERVASRTPDKTALVCGDDRLTWGEIDRRARRLAEALRGAGLTRGDRVILWMPNGPDVAVSIFAVLLAGGVFVPLSDAAGPDRVATVIRDCRATILMLSGRRLGCATEILGACPSLAKIFVSGKAIGRDGPEHMEIDAVLAGGGAPSLSRVGIDRDLACLIYTSGSTGRPKGVMSAHHNVLFVARSIVAYLENDAEDVVISALPMSFDYGLYQWLMVAMFGGTLVLERSFAYPVAFLQQAARERATGLPGVPTMFAMLLDLDLDAFDLGALRYVSNTGDALPTRLIERLRRKLPRVRVFSMYGLTETKRALYLPPDEIDRRPGSVGIAIPGTEVWIEDGEGRRLGPGEVGELVIRGGHVMRGYWGDREASAARFRPGPLPGELVCYSGDLFRRDEEGFYWFVARTDDVIKSRGEKVAPAEVEQVLCELDGVREALVTGEEDDVLGQILVARIVRRDPDLDERRVLRHCKTRLEDFKVPRRVEFTSELPRTESGKVRRPSPPGGHRREGEGNRRGRGRAR